MCLDSPRNQNQKLVCVVYNLLEKIILVFGIIFRSLHPLLILLLLEYLLSLGFLLLFPL